MIGRVVAVVFASFVCASLCAAQEPPTVVGGGGGQEIAGRETAACNAKYTFRKVRIGMTMAELKAAKPYVKKPLMRWAFVKEMYPGAEVRVVFDDGPKTKQQFTVAVVDEIGRVQALFLRMDSDVTSSGIKLHAGLSGPEVVESLVEKIGPPTTARRVSGTYSIMNGFQRVEVPQYETEWIDETCRTVVTLFEVSPQACDGGLATLESSIQDDLAKAASLQHIIVVRPLDAVLAARAARKSEGRRQLD
ncbi:MAG: hypothetical protein ABFD65_16725 [Candidatus Polarisedimenticolia bacterium]|nr:hypothetical protein [bacterium]